MDAIATAKAIARAIFDVIERDGNIVLANLEAAATDVLAGAIARDAITDKALAQAVKAKQQLADEFAAREERARTHREMLEQHMIDVARRPPPMIRPLVASDPERIREAKERLLLRGTNQIEPVNPFGTAVDHIDPAIRRAEELRKMQQAILTAPPSFQRALADKMSLASGIDVESAILGGVNAKPAEVTPDGQVPAAYGPIDRRANS